MGRIFDHHSRFDMHQQCDACTQLKSSLAQGVEVMRSLEVKVQIVKTGKGGQIKIKIKIMKLFLKK